MGEDEERKKGENRTGGQEGKRGTESRKTEERGVNKKTTPRNNTMMFHEEVGECLLKYTILGISSVL